MAQAYGKKQFIALQTPVWAGLSARAGSPTSWCSPTTRRGRKGPLAEAFQQMIADEQRPVLIARPG
jgi:hypothetical protein